MQSKGATGEPRERISGKWWYIAIKCNSMVYLILDMDIGYKKQW